jgi:hypothetical protein
MRKPFGGTKYRSPFGRPTKSDDPPVARRLDLEAKLCTAIREKVQVEFTYDGKARVYEPCAVFHSLRHKVNVAGEQVNNFTDPTDKLGPHDFEIGKIENLRVTDRKFTPALGFDRAHSKYRNGIICSI